ncbi:MAG TPA: hypothetical protein VE567_07310 [Sphingomonas sp.]|nr:hypothetical protein [Sphingomonas sp.]
MLNANGTASTVSGSSSDFGGGVSLAYDAATGGYTVRDAAGASATFLPASKNPSESNAVVSVFNQVSGNVTDQLVLFNPGPANTTLALSYVSYGAWQRLTSNGSTADVAQQYFVYGVRQGANQPSTGSASYTTKVDGLWTNPDGVYALSGSSAFTADFSAMTVATTLDLSGVKSTGTVTENKNFGRFVGSGTIAALGGGFSGTFVQQGAAGDGKVYSGGFTGAFFGPQGQEVGYTFGLTAAGAAAAGAVVGKAP